MYDSFHRKVRSDWLEVATHQPKLALLREIMSKHKELTYSSVYCKAQKNDDFEKVR